MQIGVWRLGLSKDLIVAGEFETLTALSGANYWQKAQRGLFTRLLHPAHIDVVEYLRTKGMLDRLTQFTISGQETAKALGDLTAMNIDFATLFPDLRGAAMQANVASVWQMLGVIAKMAT